MRWRLWRGDSGNRKPEARMVASAFHDEIRRQAEKAEKDKAIDDFGKMYGRTEVIHKEIKRYLDRLRSIPGLDRSQNDLTTYLERVKQRCDFSKYLVNTYSQSMPIEVIKGHCEVIKGHSTTLDSYRSNLVARYGLFEEIIKMRGKLEEVKEYYKSFRAREELLNLYKYSNIYIYRQYINSKLERAERGLGDNSTNTSNLLAMLDDLKGVVDHFSKTFTELQEKHIRLLIHVAETELKRTDVDFTEEYQSANDQLKNCIDQKKVSHDALQKAHCKAKEKLKETGVSIKELDEIGQNLQNGCTQLADAFKELLARRMASIAVGLELLGDEENSYLVRHKDGEISCWPIKGGDPSWPYAFASVSQHPELFFTKDERDPSYRDRNHYGPIRRSDQIQSTDTDLFSLPLHESVPQIRQLVLAVHNARQQWNEIGSFFKLHREQLKRSNDWGEVDKHRKQLVTSHSSAIQELKSELPNPESLRGKYDELIQRQRAMENAVLPFRLRIAIMDTQEQSAWTQGFVDFHRAFFTGEEGPGNGTEVCQRVSESLRQLEGRIAAANEMLTSETRTPENLRDACEGLDKSKAALDETLVPLRLRDTIMNTEGQYTQIQDFLDFHQEFLTELKESESGTEICQQVHKSLAQLKDDIDETKKTLTSETITSEILQGERERLDKSKTSLDEALLPIYLSMDDSLSDVSTASSTERAYEARKLQEKKEGEKIFIDHFQPEPLMFRDCSVASVRDFERLAKSLHHALKPGKSPERVYRVLYFLLREDKAIEKLKDAFKGHDQNSRSLETALTERFGEDSPQLEYALQLLGKEATEVDQIINRRPESEEKVMALLELLHNVLSKGDSEIVEGDSEIVYRALTPFQRNTESLNRLDKCYKEYKHKLKPDSQADITGLQADMKQHLKEDSLKFGLFLIGDDAWATKVVTLSEAERLSKMALQQTFERNDGVRVPVPHETENTDGSNCMFRAHIIASSLVELGYQVGKLFIHFVRTDEHGQKDAGIINPDCECWWHVACCMKVKTDSGTELRILDPSGLAFGDLDKPTLWTLEEWPDKWQEQALPNQNGEPVSYQFLPFKEWKRLIAEERNKRPEAPPTPWEFLPADQLIVFRTRLNYICIPDFDTIKAVLQPIDIPNQFGNTTYQMQGLERITKSTTWMPHARMYWHIRKEMQEPTINDDQSAGEFFDAITKKFEDAKSEFHLDKSSSTLFSNRFSKTYEAFITTHLQERGVSLEIVAQFEEYLSSHKGNTAQIRRRPKR